MSLDILQAWSYDNVHYCLDCGAEFAVLTPAGSDANFCPFCSGVNLEGGTA